MTLHIPLHLHLGQITLGGFERGQTAPFAGEREGGAPLARVGAAGDEPTAQATPTGGVL